jgi:hypothetical protein
MRGGDRVRASVKDTGSGFDSANLERLFEAFQTTKRDGMGIGLAVSHSIIQSHDGFLWGSLNDGPGATFAFSIPRAHDEAAVFKSLRAAGEIAAKTVGNPECTARIEGESERSADPRRDGIAGNRGVASMAIRCSRELSHLARNPTSRRALRPRLRARSPHPVERTSSVSPRYRSRAAAG